MKAPDYRGGDRRLCGYAPAPTCYADWFALAKRAADRFWSKVQRGPGCHLWMGTCDEDGYGRVKVTAPGHKPQLAINISAHKLALEFAIGRPILDGLVARHSCDNPPCCNQAHLIEGTQADNVRDREERGRGHRKYGEDAPRAVLTEELVIRIMALWADGKGMKRSEIRDALGVSWAAVDGVVRGRFWRQVTHLEAAE